MGAFNDYRDQAEAALVLGYLTGGFSVEQAFAAAKTRPIDIMMIGDSLQIYNNYGWDGALNKAFAAESDFGVWASPMYPQNASGNQYNNQGSRVMGVSGATGATSGADAAFDDMRHPSADYLYTETGDIGTSNGVLVYSDGELDVTANLRFHVHYGTFDSGSGSFKLGARMGESPYTSLGVDGSSISTNTGEVGDAHTSIDLAAATRDFNLQFMLRRTGGTASVGPTIFLGQRVENLDATKGVSLHSIYAVGGQSLYDMATYFQSTISTARAMWIFGTLRARQVAKGLSPIFVVRICSGFNDRTETSGPTLGPLAIGGDNPSRTQAGYADNLRGLIYKIEEAYTAQGWPPSELFFELVTPYPITDGDADLAPYRAAADEVASESRRYMHFNYTDHFDSGDIATADGTHFTNAGADTCAAVEVAALVA